MQPYLFPYLGYFQLIDAVDKFVVYDDVAFIKQGWINRNYILLNGARYLFTIPVQNISSNSFVNETIVSRIPFNWHHKMLRTIIQAYKKAPNFEKVFPLIESVIASSTDKTIAAVATDSIESVLKYLGIKKDIIKSSTIYKNDHLKNVDRVIDICIKENAGNYINAIGGKELYNYEYFIQKKITLHFLNAKTEPYQQFGKEFVNGLSVIDVLMFSSKEEILKMLKSYNLV